MIPRAADGLVLLAKPSGPTSHDVVERVRRSTGLQRVGHAGTLDPLASGLLPVVLGRATRLVRFLPHSPKLYVGTIQLGLTSDTDDTTGRSLSSHAGPWPASARVLETARALEGRQMQVPPAFSARKVEGQVLYRMARRGVKIEARPTEVEVHRFELQATERADVFAFSAEVSSGTYVRALARDLGRILGCGAVLASLQRTRIGPMRLEDATEVPVDGLLDGSLLAAAIIPLERMPLDLPAIRLSDPLQAERFTRGGAVRVDPPAGLEAAALRVLHPGGALLGIAQLREGSLCPRVVVASC